MVASLHTVLVAAFLAVTAVLLTVTVVQRIRIQDVVLTWPRLSLASVWPVVFVGVIVLLGVFAGNTAGPVPDWVFLGYVTGGTMWFAAVLLGTSVVVSRHGVVCGFGRREHALPWVQVTDYFEIPAGKRTIFVFLHRTDRGPGGRLEVPVPRAEVDRFRFLVDERLEQRPSAPRVPAPGRRATS